MSYGSYSTALGKGSESVAFYCPPNQNSTCPLQSQMPCVNAAPSLAKCDVLGRSKSGSVQLPVNSMSLKLPNGDNCADTTVPGCLVVFGVKFNDLAIVVKYVR